MASSLLKKIVETFNNKNNDGAIKIIPEKVNIKSKTYYFKHAKGTLFYWKGGKFYLDNSNKVTNFIEKINKDQEMISACRELDKIVDIAATRPVLGKYFNY